MRTLPTPLGVTCVGLKLAALRSATFMAGTVTANMDLENVRQASGGALPLALAEIIFAAVSFTRM